MKAPLSILVATDKLTLDGRTPSCIALNLCDAQPLYAALGCRLTVCNLRQADPGAERLRNAGLDVHTGPGRSISPRTLPCLLHVARACGANLLHAHGYAAANYGRMAAARLRIPAVIHEHAILPVRPHQFLFDLLLRRQTALGIAISSAVANFMVRGRCVPRARVAIIPNGIALTRFRQVADQPRGRFRARFGWATNGPLIGSAARFRHEKGLHVLFDAVQLLLQRTPGLRCVMAGDGPERTALQQRAQALGLADRLLFPGFVDDIPGFLRALDLLVIPSLQEGLCFAAMEAMATQTPLIASRTGGLPELIDDGRNGLLVPPGNAAALADGIDRLLRDPALAGTLAANAFRDIDAYALDTHVARVVARYRQLCGASAP